MKEVEEFVRQYFIDNNIPLLGKKPKQIDYVKMCIYGFRQVDCSASTATTFTKKWFWDKPNRVRIYTYILNLHDKKYCKLCNSIRSISQFYLNKSKQNKLSVSCKFCADKNTLKWKKLNPLKVNADSAKRRAAKLQRTPPWANLEKIKEFYLNCPPGYHVDHIIPLQGRNISGLHVENNLQYLTAKENLSKSNKWPYTLIK